MVRLKIYVIKDAEAINVGDILVVEQRKFYALIFFDTLQHFSRIECHGNHGNAHSFKLVCNICQLHELSFTEWSPVKRTAEHEQHAVLTC